MPPAKLREAALLALLAALMLAAQIAMAALPNIHLTAVLIILAAILFGWRALYSVYLFVLLEGLVYGFGIWTVNYLYIWTVLAAAAVLFRKSRSRWFWAAVAGGFGLLFGALCAVPFAFLSGWPAAFAYWAAGIPFDLIHGVSNAVLTAVLLPPLCRLGTRLLGRPQDG